MHAAAPGLGPTRPNLGGVTTLTRRVRTIARHAEPAHPTRNRRNARARATCPTAVKAGAAAPSQA